MDQKNQNLYLAPEQLTANEANEKARPAEKPEDRARRVSEMAQSIAANGQEYPVLIVEQTFDGGETITYEYVDGGCRVEAIAKLNDNPEEFPEGVGGHDWSVWCSLVDPTEDLFKKAVVANLHRTQNSILDMGHIVQEAFDRNNWKGRGSGKKVAEYLGIGESRVSELLKIVRADGPLKSMIDRGEVTSVDAALKILETPVEKRVEVTERARAIAAEDEAEDAKKANKAKGNGKGKGKGGNPTPKVPLFDPMKHKPAVAKVKAKHVEAAKRDTGVDKSPRAKSEVAAFFEAVSPAAYGPKAVSFAEYMVKWMGGEGTDKTLREKFDAIADKGTPAPIQAPVKATKVAKKAAAPKKSAPKKKK